MATSKWRYALLAISPGALGTRRAFLATSRVMTLRGPKELLRQGVSIHDNLGPDHISRLSYAVANKSVAIVRPLLQ